MAIHPVVLYHIEKTRCITVKYNSLIFVIKYYMFQFNKPLSGIKNSEI